MPQTINFPVWGSYKIDGVRGMVRDARLVSRSLKPIRNKVVQTLLGSRLLEGLDGELAVGSPTHPNLMQITTSGVMSVEGTPDFRFFVFDICNLEPSLMFADRLSALRKAFCTMPWSVQISTRIHLLEQTLINNQEELDAFEADALALGFEGVICRDPAGRYKYGRSTAKEGIMFKVKRFKTSEARITGYKEEMYNSNVAQTNELGHTFRTSHKEGKIGKGTLGAFEGIDIHDGRPVSVGTGFTAAQRAEFWARPEKYLGKIITYKHFDHGVKDRPRHQVFLAFRDLDDMS